MNAYEIRLNNVKLMHNTMIDMNNENAYFTWIYIMPDEPMEDDFEWFAEDEMEIENEDLISENEIAECDLTNNEDYDIIIADDESDVNDEDVVEIEDSEPTLEDILIDECPFYVIDEIYEIDSYAKGNWYCYYIYADGDVYVVTTKNGHVDICVQLN